MGIHTPPRVRQYNLCPTPNDTHLSGPKKVLHQVDEMDDENPNKKYFMAPCLRCDDTHLVQVKNVDKAPTEGNQESLLDRWGKEVFGLWVL